MKQLIVVVNNENRIDYDENDKVKFYTIGMIHREYLERLISKHQDVLVVLNFDNLESYLTILKDLERPVLMLLNCKWLEKTQFQLRTILMLQILRLLSLRYQGTILSIRDEIGIENVSSLTKTFKEKPIFDIHMVEYDTLEICLNIPSSWDSWNKIVVYGKSIILPSEDNERIVKDEIKLKEIENVYENYLDNKSTIKDFDKFFQDPIEETPPRTIPASFSEFLKTYVNM